MLGRGQQHVEPSRVAALDAPLWRCSALRSEESRMARSVPSTLVHSDAQRQTRVRDMRREIATSESIEPSVNLLGGSASLLKIVKTVNVRRERVNEVAVATLEAARQAGRMLTDLRLAGGQRRGRSRNTSPTRRWRGASPHAIAAEKESGR